MDSSPNLLFASNTLFVRPWSLRCSERFIFMSFNLFLLTYHILVMFCSVRFLLMSLWDKTCCHYVAPAAFFEPFDVSDIRTSLIWRLLWFSSIILTRLTFFINTLLLLEQLWVFFCLSRNCWSCWWHHEHPKLDYCFFPLWLTSQHYWREWHFWTDLSIRSILSVRRSTLCSFW